jgi:hypothetical protein
VSARGGRLLLPLARTIAARVIAKEHIMYTMVVKPAAAVTCIGLACPGIAIAQPSPEVPDIPEVGPQHVEQFEAALGEEIAYPLALGIQ